MSRAEPASQWMWAQACELMVQADRLQRHYFRPIAPQESQAAWEPPVDVYEDEREIVVVIAMPGVAVSGLGSA